MSPNCKPKAATMTAGPLTGARASATTRQSLSPEGLILLGS